MKNLKYNIIKEDNNNIITLFFKNNFVKQSHNNGYNFYINNDYNIVITKNGMIIDIIVLPDEEKEYLKNARFIYIVDEKTDLVIVLKIKNQLLNKNLDKYLRLEK